jgi:sugar/nucleoside kinase (ribokinase family)
VPPRLLSAGEAFEDLIFIGLDRLPAPGEEVRTNQFTSTIGGGAVITAVAAARLGLRVEIASGLAAAAATRLRAEGVTVTNLRSPAEPHAVSAALSTTHERAFVTFDGVNTKLEPRLARAMAATKATHVHLAFYPRDCARWTARVRALRRRGVTTSADFGWNDALANDPALPALFDALDVVFVNEREAALYASAPLGAGPAESLDASLPFWRARRSTVVIKLGASGSRIVGRAGELHAVAPRVTAVDTTGAGDAFNGGFLHAWLTGRPLARCLEAGNRIGAASTRRAGGLDALPPRRRRRA